MRDFLHIALDPLQLLFGLIAVCGGVARYLNSYATGAPFKFSILAASAFVAGFSGYMFGLLGQSMQLPIPMLLIMAGVGGFFGEQTMKLIYEYIVNKKLVDNSK
jgi:uncharacterized membrane-anchored protein